MPIVTESPYQNTDEAAQYLRLMPRTLKNMRWKGQGPRYRKHGTRVFYHIKDLAKWSGDHDCNPEA